MRQMLCVWILEANVNLQISIHTFINIYEYYTIMYTYSSNATELSVTCPSCCGPMFIFWHLCSQDFFGLMEYRTNKRQIKRHTKFQAKHDVRGYDDDIETVKLRKGTKVRFLIRWKSWIWYGRRDKGWIITNWIHMNISKVDKEVIENSPLNKSGNNHGWCDCWKFGKFCFDMHNFLHPFILSL